MRTPTFRESNSGTFSCALLFSGDKFLKGKNLPHGEQNLYFKNSSILERPLYPGKQTGSHKLFPFEKLQKNMEVYPNT